MDIEKTSDSLIYIASKAVLNDLLWTFFGYKKRPLNGKLFSLFKSKSEINRINFLSREFFLYIIAVDLLKYNPEDQEKMIEYIDTKYFLSPSLDLSKSFGFKNKTEMFLYFKQGLFDFKGHSYNDFAQLLADRFITILKNDLKNEWLVGVARMNVHFKGW